MGTIHGLQAVLAHLGKLPRPETLTVAARRAQYDRAERAFTLPAGTRVETLRIEGVLAEWLVPAGARDDAALLYLHGGGYVIGSPRSHRHLAAAIASAAGIGCLVPDYRLAPEHPFPAALDDAAQAYGWLQGRGFAAKHLFVAGDSAGGGLAVALLLRLREGGLALPGAAACLSPWADLTMSGDSYDTKAATDPMVTREDVAEMAQRYLAGRDARLPLVSPLFADLDRLPPLLVQVGSEEVLLDDAVRLHQAARAAGVDATLEVWPGMIHVWQWFLPWLDEAQTAVARIGAFLASRLG